jgi:hypothetical protein
MNNAMLPAYGADEFKTKPIGIETVVYKGNISCIEDKSTAAYCYKACITC